MAHDKVAFREYAHQIGILSGIKMVPKPDTVGPIGPMSNENPCNKSDTKNQYTNKAFVEDERHTSPMNGTVRSSIRKTSVQHNNLDFDDILPHIGEFGRYQKMLFFLMIPFAFFVAFVYFSQIFITLVPERHWCRIHELEHLPIEQR